MYSMNITDNFKLLSYFPGFLNKYPFLSVNLWQIIATDSQSRCLNICILPHLISDRKHDTV